MSDDIDGAMQHAPHPIQQSIILQRKTYNVRRKKIPRFVSRIMFRSSLNTL